MLVYLASGWDNPHTKQIKHELHRMGHDVYHFLDSGYELDYNRVQSGLRFLSGYEQADALSHPMIAAARNINCNQLNIAGAFILVEPAGKGSFTEYGMALRMRIPTILYVTPEYQIGVMDSMFEYVVKDPAALEATLGQIPERR